jgi:hypothetical protein
VQGPFYGMDRDKRWERVQQAMTPSCGGKEPITRTGGGRGKKLRGGRDGRVRGAGGLRY